MSLGKWILAARPKTLPAAIVPVAIGSALASLAGEFAGVPALLCLAFALAMQVGTNFANDYLDWQRGADREDRLGPAPAVASGWISAGAMRRATMIVLGAGFLIGSGLVVYGGPWLILVGIASVLCAYAYTGGPYPLAYHGLGDVFVVLFFGLIAVCGTFFVQVGTVDVAVVLLALATGLCINNLLLINNYRDFESDRASGKRTTVVLFGRGFGLLQYMGSLAAAAGFIAWAAHLLDERALYIAILPILIGMRQFGRLRRAKTAAQFDRLLLITALILIVFGMAVVSALVRL